MLLGCHADGAVEPDHLAVQHGILDDLASQYDGRLKIAKINVDDNPQTPGRYGVRGIPNLLIIKGGQVKEQIIGQVPKSHLVRAVDSALA